MLHNEKLAGGGGRGLPLVKSFDRMVRRTSNGTMSAEVMYEEYAKSLGLPTREGLQKALATNAITGYGDATPLRLENLDSTMTEVLVRAEHLKLFRMLPRVPSIQEHFQWMRHTDYGSHRGSPGFRQGGAPSGGVSTWARGNTDVRWMGVLRGYTHQLQVTGQMGGTFIDPIMAENNGGTRQLLEIIERWLVWGQSAILDKDGNTVNYDGIYQQLLTARPKSIIDKAGDPMTFEDMEKIGFLLNTDGKLANFNDVYSLWHSKVLSDLGILKLQAERIILGSPNMPTGFVPGVPLNGYNTQFGEIPFDFSILLDQVEQGAPLVVTQTNAPVRPASVTATPGAGTTTIPAGTLYYFVSSMGDAGESDTVAATGAAVTAGQQVVIAPARVAAATAYRIYRSDGVNDVTKAKWIATVTQDTLGVGAGSNYTDTNQIMPGTYVGIVMNVTTEDIVIAQMLPLIKYPLARITTTEPFLLLLYHVLAIKAPERVLFIKNIGNRIPLADWRNI